MPKGIPVLVVGGLNRFLELGIKIGVVPIDHNTSRLLVVLMGWMGYEKIILQKLWDA